MQIFIVSPDTASERIAALVRLLQHLGHSPSAVASWQDGSLGQSQSRSAKLIIVANTSGEEKTAEQAIEHLAADHGSSFLIYIADTIVPDVYKRLVKSERGDWISWQALPQELPELVSKVTSLTDDHEHARVVTFFPSGGGVGNTTLAAEVGFCLASENKKPSPKVAVVDLNFQDSSLADILDLEPRLNVSELIDRPERLDDRLIDIFTSRYSPSFDVFSGPTLFDGRQKAYSGVVFPLLDALSKRYDLVLIDLPHHWSPWVDNVIQGSDGVVLTGGSAVPAVKQLLMRMRHIESLEVPHERIKIVVNKCDFSLFGKVRRKQDVDRVLSRGNPLYIPRDFAIANEAANTGRPILEIAPRRPVSKSIRVLAHWVRTVTSQASVSAKKP